MRNNLAHYLPTGGFLDLLLFRRLIASDLAERFLKPLFVFIAAKRASGFNETLKLARL
jgi:hypothetical protein